MSLSSYIRPSALYNGSSTLVHHLRKVPPVTRFLSLTSLALFAALYLRPMWYWKFIYLRERVVSGYEVWRILTSFTSGNLGLNYVFDLALLYRYSDILESGPYACISPTYAWHLILAMLSIIVINTPLNAVIHHRPLVTCLTTLSTNLAPPSSQLSLLGFFTMPLTYLPYLIIFIDLIARGPRAAAQSVGGAIIGQVWYAIIKRGWEVRLGSAPKWMRYFVADGVPADMRWSRDNEDDDKPKRGWGMRLPDERQQRHWGTSVRVTAAPGAGLGGGCCGGSNAGFM